MGYDSAIVVLFGKHTLQTIFPHKIVHVVKKFTDTNIDTCSEKMGSKNSPSKRLSLTSEGKSSELGHFLLISESIPAKKKKN